MAEQRYRAVLAVISDGRTVTEVAAGVGVSHVAASLTEPQSTRPPRLSEVLGERLSARL